MKLFVINKESMNGEEIIFFAEECRICYFTIKQILQQQQQKCDAFWMTFLKQKLKIYGQT